MIRIATSVVCAVFLSACTTVPDWATVRHILNGDTSGPGLAQYSFDWHLSGKRQVAPLQVFDDGKHTWLHFLPDQIVPAVFQHTAQGDRLLPYARQGEYLRLDGVWPVLSFRGGDLSASAHKHFPDGTGNDDTINMAVADFDPDVDPNAHAMPVTMNMSPRMPMQTEKGHGTLGQINDSSVSSLHDEDRNPSKAHVPIVKGNPVNDEVRRLTDASFDSLAHASYSVRLHDQNLRNALHRWAARANWTFAPEHWDVDVDIPISGEADFHGSFQDAVQDVLASTELADRPLRPCFYSNRVLRVVAYTQSCDRSGAQTS